MFMVQNYLNIYKQVKQQIIEIDNASSLLAHPVFLNGPPRLEMRRNLISTISNGTESKERDYPLATPDWPKCGLLTYIR